MRKKQRPNWRVWLHHHSRGQGLVETALLFPVLLIVLSGLVEIGFLINDYLDLQDAARNAARFAADGLYYAQDSIHVCTSTRDFSRQTACLVNQELSQQQPQITLNFGNSHDDVIVSAFAVASGPTITPFVTARFPGGTGDAGWSAAQDTLAWGSRNQSSRFTTANINSRLNAAAPSTGIVLVEIFYDYHQKLRLPWITAFLSDPVLLHAYAIMPLVSAEPTPTAIPTP